MTNTNRPAGLENVQRAELAEVIAVWREHRKAKSHEELMLAKHEIIALMSDFAVEYHEQEES